MRSTARSRTRKSWNSSRAARERSSGAFRRQPMREDFAQDFTPDRLVRCSRIAPPPAVLLHRIGGSDKTVRDGDEIGLGVVETEDQPAGADPAECQTFGAQIVLEHPVVARRLGVKHGPDRREI